MADGRSEGRKMKIRRSLVGRRGQWALDNRRSARRPRHRWLQRTPIVAMACALPIGSALMPVGSAHARQTVPLEIQSLDGSRNNVFHPDWGKAGLNYARVAPPRYADGHSALFDAPGSRYVS